MKATEMWCERCPPDGMLRHFYPSPISVRMHETEDSEILRVNVVEDPAGTHWGWWDTERARFMFVYEHLMLLKMCFPYGPEVEEKLGRGRVLQVRIDVLGPEEST